jgi:predicted ATPase/DNA-binding SARP family transcriptional activator
MAAIRGSPVKTSIHIQLLGGFKVWAGDRPLPDDTWRLRKGRSLVKLIALAPGHSMHRERVCELLWPERDAASSANNLHQAVHSARRALTQGGADGHSLLTLQQGLLALPGVTTDVDRFRAAASAAGESGDPLAHREAIELYTGELLPEDLYEEWAAAPRRSLREQNISLLVALGRLERERGESAVATEPLRRVLEEDPLHEQATRELMRLLAAEGRRQEALGAYQRLREALRSDLEADPDPETRRLYRELLAGSLETAEEAEASTPARERRHNLPHEPSSFIGRERELRAVDQRLADTRMLTLVGAGGVGKTRLAQEAAAARVENFADGVWLVELAVLTDPELIPSEIATAVGLDLPDGRQPLPALVDGLSDRHALLVLDNCEHLIDECARVASELLRACPHLSLLATSREPLRIDGEVAWRVPSLALPDPEHLPDLADLERLESVRLFCERAAAAAPGFHLEEGNARAVAELCSRLDGMPLALELAAARTGLLSPNELAERLALTLDSLGEGSRARLTRQRTLTATLDWSHDLLGEAEQVLFRRLAVFAGTFSLEAVEGVCVFAPLDRDAALDPLGRLVEKSLVLVERGDPPARYRLLETVRQYARDRLREAEELDRIERRHLDWFTAFAEAHDPELTADRLAEEPRVVEADHDNLRAALRTALTSAPEEALRLAASLWRFWLSRGYFAEGRRWLDAALRAAPEPSDLRARALVAASVLDMRRGEFGALDHAGDEVIAIRRRLKDPVALAEALHVAGLWDWILPGAPDKARRRIEESAALAHEIGADYVIAAAEHGLGLIDLGRGDAAAARKHLERSRELVDEVGEVRRGFLPAVTLGWIPQWDEEGRPRVSFVETVVLGHRLGREHGAAFLTSSLAWVAWREGDLEAALALAEESAQRSRDLGWDYGGALALSLLGNIQRRRGELDAASASLARSLELRRGLGDRRATGVTLGNLGLLAAARGDPSGSYRALREALELFERTEDGPGAMGTLLNMAVVAELAGDLAAARGLLEQSLEGRASFGAGAATGWMTAMLAELAEREDEREEAERLRAQAVASFEEVGAQDGIEYCAQVQRPTPKRVLSGS